MDNSYWYYTLSAIPQTLAAALALAATFVIFKMSMLHGRIESRAAEAAKLLAIAESGSADDGEIDQVGSQEKTLEGLDELLAGLKGGVGAADRTALMAAITEYYHSFGEEHHQFFVPPATHDGDDAPRRKVAVHMERLRDSLAVLLEHKRRSFGYLRLNLIFTLAPMSLSLFLLPLHDYIEHDPFHGVLIDDLLVAVLVACAIASLSYTAYSVWKIANY